MRPKGGKKGTTVATELKIEPQADLLSHLKSVVRIQELVSATDAAVDTAQGHEEAKGEEVPMVKMAHAVIQPG